MDDDDGDDDDDDGDDDADSDDDDDDDDDDRGRHPCALQLFLPLAPAYTKVSPSGTRARFSYFSSMHFSYCPRSSNVRFSYFTRRSSVR